MENTAASSGNKPEKKFRVSPVSATIWQNQGTNKNGEPVSFRTISIERNYKDKNDQWQSTNSFRLSDLPKVALVANKAYEYLVVSEEGDDKEGNVTAGYSEEEVVM